MFADKPLRLTLDFHEGDVRCAALVCYPDEVLVQGVYFDIDEAIEAICENMEGEDGATEFYAAYLSDDTGEPMEHLSIRVTERGPVSCWRCTSGNEVLVRVEHTAHRPIPFLGRSGWLGALVERLDETGEVVESFKVYSETETYILDSNGERVPYNAETDVSGAAMIHATFIDPESKVELV